MAARARRVHGLRGDGQPLQCPGLQHEPVGVDQLWPAYTVMKPLATDLVDL
ncbi:hypothetical protein ACFQY4_26000 [Catellatospora bangladeshensis]|uniref:hypothetical protein n=1 Tax=Catellatospora bangladeshensis TaxID=310355 RepID=UPI00360B065F